MNMQVSTNIVNCHIRKRFLYIFLITRGMKPVGDAVPMHWEENVKFGEGYVYCTKECHSERKL